METRGISLGQVQWGNPDSEPSFWPNEVMHWSWVQNIAQSKGNSESLRQIGYPTEILMADILRLAVLRRLQSRVIDWRQWVDSDADQTCTTRRKPRALEIIGIEHEPLDWSQGRRPEAIPTQQDDTDGGEAARYLTQHGSLDRSLGGEAAVSEAGAEEQRGGADNDLLTQRQETVVEAAAGTAQVQLHLTQAVGEAGDEDHVDEGGADQDLFTQRQETVADVPHHDTVRQVFASFLLNNPQHTTHSTVHSVIFSNFSQILTIYSSHPMRRRWNETLLEGFCTGHGLVQAPPQAPPQLLQPALCPGPQLEEDAVAGDGSLSPVPRRR